MMAQATKRGADARLTAEAAAFHPAARPLKQRLAPNQAAGGAKRSQAAPGAAEKLA